MRIFYSILFSVLLFPLFFSTTLISQTLAPDFSIGGFPKFTDEVIPSPFIYVEGIKSSHIILVEKRGQTLFLLNQKNGKVNIEKSYICSTGKELGDKKIRGDFKTPEGIYFSRSRIDSTELHDLYGAGAFVLDYPNKFDIIDKKNGQGIWIHGTNEPERLQNSNDTEGCIVLKNEDFLDLAQYIVLNQTTVVVVNEIEYRNTEYVKTDRNEILSFFEDWQNSWKSKDIDSYTAFYSRRFRYKDKSFNYFRAYKKNLFERYKQIDLVLENIQVFKTGQYALISFIQNFSTDSYSDAGMKQLYVVKEKKSYKIIEEIWTEINN